MSPDAPPLSPSLEVKAKIMAWQARLLDFTRRNPLLSLPAKSLVRLDSPPFTPDELFSRLTGGTKTAQNALTFVRDTASPLSDDTDEAEGAPEEIAPSPSASRRVLKAGQKAVSEAEYKLLNTLRIKARLSLTEQGINILFLTRGTLEWIDPKTNAATRSPLLLIPVELEKLPAAQGDGFILRRFDDDVRVNPTLCSRLAQADIGFTLPTVADEDDIDAPAYFEAVRQSLQNTSRTASWNVLTDESFLGRFSFLKLVMYEDLARQADAAAVHPLIATLAGQTSAVQHLPSVTVPPANELDDAPAENSLHVLPADPSQERAVLAARMGQSFVLQGPPGTGKTQTIANILAACIADGKRVLFVSEKMAALDAVYKRLHGANLGDLCLEAHSHKAGKKDILASLQKSLNAVLSKNANANFREADALNAARDHLNEIACELHKTREPLGISLYEAFGFLADTPSLPSLPFVLGKVETVGADELRQRERLAHQLTGFHDLFAQAETHPWRAMKTTEFSSDLQNRLRAALTDLLAVAQAEGDVVEMLTGQCGLQSPSEPSPAQCAPLEEIADLLTRTPRPPKAWLQNTADLAELRQTAETARDTWRDCASRRVDLEYDYAPAFFRLLHETLAERLTSRHDALLRPALGAKWAEGSPSFYAALNETLRRVKETCIKLGGSASALAILCGLPAPKTLTEARFAAKVADCALADPRPLPGWFAESGRVLTGLVAFASQAQKHQTEHDAQKAELMNAGYLSALFSLDVGGLLARFTGDYASVFRFFKPAYWRDRSTLRQVVSASGTLKNRDIPADLQAAHSVNDHAAWLQKNAAELSRAFGPRYQAAQTEWDSVLRALEQTRELCALFSQAAVPPPLQARLVASGAEVETLSAQAAFLARHLSDAEKELGAGGELAALSALPEQDTTPIALVPLAAIADWCEKMQASATDLADARATVLTTRLNTDFESELEPPISSSRLVSALNQARRLLLDEESLRVEAETLKKRFAQFFDAQNTDWESLLDAILWTNELRQAVPAFGRMPASAPLPDALVHIACESTEVQTAQIARTRGDLQTHRKTATRIWQELDALLNLDAHDGSGIPIQNAAFQKQVAWAKERIDRIGELERVLQFMQNKAACQRAGLTSFWEVVTRHSPPENLIVPAFRAAFYKRFVEAVAQTVPGLAAFSGREQDTERETFARLDRTLIVSAPARIRAKAHARKGRLNGLGSDLGELGTLKKQLAMKRPWAVRKLLSSIPNVLFLLKPCLLMSPLSVSLFLDADRIWFDVVVFDEASQIFTESAIGSLLRAKQAIIAGDTKQLPPTAFFKGLSDEEDDDDEGETSGSAGEFESVLSAASACANDETRFASHPLLWHYRSRHESLIGFSRAHFYDRLQTFPSASVPSALHFDYVPEGRYYGGAGSRRDNPVEAARVADLVVEHIRAHPAQSVGVITMSEAQQNAIYAAVEKRKIADPRLAGLLPEEGPEGFFVKNIENVQGDERDVIFLSIGYGRDAKTNVFRLNFGPLNKDGGERRLNVAVTRARMRCVTVASFLPSEIDPSRTDKRGPLLLRSYLENAQAAAPETNIGGLNENGYAPEEDRFAQTVATALIRRGYTVRQNVGLFDFRVDIGILDDENPDRFLLGIECDGSNYVSGETARARDYLRDDVLRGLDWRLLRIWSADWARDSVAVLQTIESAIDRAKRGDPEPFEVQESISAAVSEEKTTQNAAHDAFITTEQEGPVSDIPTDAMPPSPLPPVTAATSDLLSGLTYFTPMSDTNLAHLARAFWACDPTEQAALLTRLVEAEGPLPFGVAAQKLANAAGYSRAGNRLQQTVRDAANGAMANGTVEEIDGFLWPSGAVNAPPARVPRPSDEPRPLEQICLEEIGAVMVALLRAAVGMGQNEAIDETARLLGFARTGPAIRERITEALSLLEISHQAHVRGGQVYTFDA